MEVAGCFETSVPYYLVMRPSTVTIWNLVLELFYDLDDKHKMQFYKMKEVAIFAASLIIKYGAEAALSV
jgi:hypothetical protein